MLLERSRIYKYTPSISNSFSLAPIIILFKFSILFSRSDRTFNYGEILMGSKNYNLHFSSFKMLNSLSKGMYDLYITSDLVLRSRSGYVTPLHLLLTTISSFYVMSPKI